MKITISNLQENATPAVVCALQRLKEAGGGELHFEQGEYHFYKSGCEKRFLAVSNNSACDKYIAFPIIEAEIEKESLYQELSEVDKEQDH